VISYELLLGEHIAVLRLQLIDYLTRASHGLPLESSFLPETRVNEILAMM
jgi:hypothetical protein